MKKYLLGLVMVAAACGGSSSVSVTDLPNKLLDATCKNYVACEVMPDLATCKASLQEHDMFFATVQADVASKKVKYDGGEAQKCIDEVSAEGCTFVGFQADPNDPCAKIFTGTVAAGGACVGGSDECAGDGSFCNPTDSSCDSTTTCCPGTCMAGAAKVAIGQPCQSTSDCVDGAYCAQTSGLCAGLVATEGGACDGIDGCVNPMVCNLDFTTFMFTTCFTPAARNAACDTNNLLPCADERDYCDTTTMKCTPVLTTGGSCGGSNGATCAFFDTCDMTSMMCTANPGAGQACTVDSNGQSNCLGDLQCTGGMCQLPPAGGACM